MAITGNFDIDKALSSQSYAYQCWNNFYNYNNTMGISLSDMSKITSEWSSEIPNWQLIESGDETAYEIEDDDYDTAYNIGYEKGVDATGGEEKDADAAESIVATASTAVATTGSAAAVAGSVLTAFASAKLGTASSIVNAAAAGALLATATWLVSSKPNSDEASACGDLEDEMTNMDGELESAQANMDEARANTVDLADSAEETNEETNEIIEEYNEAKARYDELTAKMDSGEELTDAEQAELEYYGGIIEEYSSLITEGSEEVDDIYGSMEDVQETYDESGETIAEADGLTDYAASFDEATKSNADTLKNAAKWGIVGSALTVANGAAHALKWWNLGDVALGIASMGLGAAAGIEYNMVENRQSDYEKTAASEVEARVNTQDISSTTNDMYAESLDDYDASLTFVDNLEWTEVYEETESGEGDTGSTSDTGTTDTANTADTGTSTAGTIADEDESEIV